MTSEIVPVPEEEECAEPVLSLVSMLRYRRSAGRAGTSQARQETAFPRSRQRCAFL